MTYRTRQEPCGECSGQGETLRAIRWAGEAYGELASERCPYCDGDGEVDASCEECGTVTALSDDLMCERCCDSVTLTVDEFELKYLGGGRWRVAA